MSTGTGSFEAQKRDTFPRWIIKSFIAVHFLLSALLAPFPLSKIDVGTNGSNRNEIEKVGVLRLSPTRICLLS